MIADSQCVSHDRQGWIDGAARREEARINDVKVVEFVSFTIAVECGRFWIVAKAHGAILVCHCRERQSLAQVKIAREQALAVVRQMAIGVAEGALVPQARDEEGCGTDPVGQKRPVTS